MSLKVRVEMRLSFLMLVLVVLTGCIQFTCSDGLNRTISGMNVAEQFQALEITEVRPVLVRKGGCCMLSLEADGRFVKHISKSATYNVSGRRRVLAVGFFPGTWSCPGMDITMVWVVPLSAVVANVITLGYPTWNAVFIEPFRDYHDATVGAGIETWSFMGCRKYLGSNVSETETDCNTQHEPFKSVVL